MMEWLTSRLRNLASGFHLLLTKSLHTSSVFTPMAATRDEVREPSPDIVTDMAFLRIRWPVVECFDAPRMASESEPGATRFASCDTGEKRIEKDSVRGRDKESELGVFSEESGVIPRKPACTRC